jgi:hypothetical protein
MNMTLGHSLNPTQWPVVRLLHPRQYGLRVLVVLVVGILIAWAGITLKLFPLWAGTLIVLAALLPTGLAKWRDDVSLFGWVITLLGILLTAQGLHTVEHIVQWLQYHALYWTMRQSNGLVSAANAEWVHFIWNWAVLICVALLVKGGLRNAWAWVLLAVVVAHTFEHTYMFVRHLQVLNELRGLGVTNLTAQGLPGILGRDGWLARSDLTQGTVLCSLPILTTVVRLDVHFGWNMIEMALLLPAAHVFLRGRLGADG